MATARAGSKEEALKLLATGNVSVVELDYEAGWQDAVELGRVGQKSGIRVEYRGHENIAVKSRGALVAGLNRPKTTFRQRNLYCLFNLNKLGANDLAELEAKASSLGDYIFAGHLLQNADSIWAH